MGTGSGTRRQDLPGRAASRITLAANMPETEGVNLDSLLTEQPNPVSEGLDRLGTEQLLRVINAEDRKVPEAVAAVIPQIAAAVELITRRLRAGGHLFYIGAGTSGRLGVLDAAECPPTFQVPADLVQGILAGGEAALARATEAREDDPELGARDLRERGFSGGDVLVGITASGRTPYVLGAVRAARQLGAPAIGLTANPGSQLARTCDLAIVPVTGPEVIAGSTRMKAGTAAKLVLNMISTAVMVGLGHVYGNLMVNVRPTNEKLAARARRIVAQVGRTSPEEAARLLEEAGGEVKTAVLMARRKLEPELARERLAQVGGSLSAALGE